jgi:hypothetical protein
MATSVKTKPKKAATNHKCLKASTIKRQGELIERIGKVTLGNGTPEDGLLFQFRSFLIDHKKSVDNVAEIKGMVTKALEDAATTRHAFELYKTHEEGTNEAEREKRERDGIANALKLTKSRDLWYKILTILGIACAIYFGFKNNRQTSAVETKVDNLGDPVVTNPRGEFVPLPDGFSLKMWPRDFDEAIQDTVKQ